MPVRSSAGLEWICCGNRMPSRYTHCPFCGASVMLVDRVPLRLGDVAVVSHGEISAQAWRSLADIVESCAKMFEKREVREDAGRVGNNHCGPHDISAGAEAPELTSSARADATIVVREATGEQVLEEPSHPSSVRAESA
jgi:hypothetical protein